ncbi:hypothetical protein ACJMK2_043717 [Sinanodonta woodiana]|uniref:Arrestin C-terminal-like domain-containing protein n=1 Tax=Sinanodonta woodiana TaxID=1069815 RepID=A0ABD3VYB2_SINWO
MAKDRIIISFNNASRVFYPGQIVEVNVQLTVVESLKMREANQLEDIILLKGVYNYPFKFQLPLNIPSSYESFNGRVGYAVIVAVDNPWPFGLETMGHFTVVSLLDLNKLPNVANGGTVEDEKTLCCLCCKSGPIRAMLSTDRLGYVPGEAIKFRAVITNLSNRQMECSKAQLIMKVHYHAGDETNTVMHVLSALKRPPIPAGATDYWSGYKLHVPPVPPSFLLGCKIIDIHYYIMIIVDPSGPSFDLNVPMEVTIGSIPLQTVAQMYGIPSAEDVHGVVGHGMLPPCEQFPDNIPKPVMAKRVIGGVNVNAVHPESSHYFAPVYPYYNWEKPDPNVTFQRAK